MKINNVLELKAAIAKLEKETAIGKQELNNQFRSTVHSFNPLNIVRGFMKKIDPPELVSNLLSASVGAGAGALSKRILVGKPNNFFTKIIGKVIQFAVSSVVTKKV